MLLAQHSARGLGLWSLGLPAPWWAALSAQSGADRFGDRRIVLTHAGSIIPSTGIAGITPVDGIIIKLTRVEGDDGLSLATSVFLKPAERGRDTD